MDLDRDQVLEVAQLIRIYSCTNAAAIEAIGLTSTMEDACKCFEDDGANLKMWRAKHQAAIRAGRREVSLRSDGEGASTDALATPPPPAASSPLTEPDSGDTLPSVPPPVPPPPQLDEDEDEQEMTKAFKKLYNENPAAAVSWLEQMFSDVALAQLPPQDNGNGKRKCRD